ncbi:MAG TPA: hypothetical protein VGK34_04280 [Armatimonadota bacterium]|jgi:hypothetical protein
MKQNKITEFVTVLAFAIVAGAGGMFISSRLSGTAQAIALIALFAGIIISWQYLRKRFGRG